MKYIFHIIVILLCPFILLLFFKKNEGFILLLQYYGPFKGYDYGGNDIAHYESITKEKCMEYCNGQSRCRGIVKTDSDAHCWLKSKFENKGPAPGDGRNVYYRPKEFVSVNDASYRHNDVGRYADTNIEQCKNECINNDACKGFVFQGTDCWLKSKFENYHRWGGAMTFWLR